MPVNISVNPKLQTIIDNCPKKKSYANFLVEMLEEYEKENDILMVRLEKLETFNAKGENE